MKKKSDFNCGMVAQITWAGLNVPETDFHTELSLEFTQNGQKTTSSDISSVACYMSDRFTL